MSKPRQLCLILFLFSTVAMYAGEGAQTVKPYIKEAISSSDRPEPDRPRDAFRKPGQVLQFFDIKPGQRIVELMAGAGYYSELLARVVGPKGQVWAQNNAFVLQRFAEEKLAKRLANPNLSNIKRLDRELDDPHLPENLDSVLMILFYHDTYWQGVNREKMNAAVFKALKSGGSFGIVDHHAEVGSGSRDVSTIHRVDRALVVKEILAAGFQLVAESDVLRHTDDPRTENVFKKEIRGKTDRFILKFRKP